MLRLLFPVQTSFLVLAIGLACPAIALGQQPKEQAAQPDAVNNATFQKSIQPLFKEFCWRCHNADNMKSGIRVDHLAATPEDRHLPLVSAIATQVGDNTMPPEDEPQPTAAQRKALTDWASRTLAVARSRPVPKNGSIRRLTVAQY